MPLLASTLKMDTGTMKSDDIEDARSNVSSIFEVTEKDHHMWIKKSALEQLYDPNTNIFKYLLHPRFQNNAKVQSVMDEIRIQEKIRAAEMKKVYSTKVSTER